MKKTIALLLVALSLFCTSCNEVKNGETAVTPNPTIEAQEAMPNKMTALEFTEKFMELYIKQDTVELEKITTYPVGNFESGYLGEGATLSLVKVQTVEEFKAENPDIGGYSEEVPEYEGFYDVQNFMVTVNYENMLYEHENGEDTSIFTVGKSVQDNEWKVIYAFGNF